MGVIDGTMFWCSGEVIHIHTHECTCRHGRTGVRMAYSTVCVGVGVLVGVVLLGGGVN